MISWKLSFKRLNEEYDLAKRKKQALDSLYETGKISQSTHDSFNDEIASALAEIERQQKSLLEKMQLKSQELQGQIKTLEMLLANNEIQHVGGEIDDEIYKREINLLASGLETAKQELGVIKEAANQLSSPVQPEAKPCIPKENEMRIENATVAVAEVIPAEVTLTVATPIEATPAEVTPAEIAPAEVIPVEATLVEAPATETIPVEAANTEAAATEVAPAEIAPAEATPAEATPIEAAPIEAAAAEITTTETPPIETIATEIAPVEASPTEATPVECTPVEAAPIEANPEEAAPVEAIPLEVAPVESAPAETIQEISPKESVATVDIVAPEKAATENVEVVQTETPPASAQEVPSETAQTVPPEASAPPEASVPPEASAPPEASSETLQAAHPEVSLDNCPQQIVVETQPEPIVKSAHDAPANVVTHENEENQES